MKWCLEFHPIWVFCEPDFMRPKKIKLFCYVFRITINGNDQINFDWFWGLHVCPLWATTADSFCLCELINLSCPEYFCCITVLWINPDCAFWLIWWVFMKKYWLLFTDAFETAACPCLVLASKRTRSCHINLSKFKGHYKLDHLDMLHETANPASTVKRFCWELEVRTALPFWLTPPHESQDLFQRLLHQLTAVFKTALVHLCGHSITF